MTRPRGSASRRNAPGRHAPDDQDAPGRSAPGQGDAATLGDSLGGGDDGLAGAEETDRLSVGVAVTCPPDPTGADGTPGSSTAPLLEGAAGRCEELGLPVPPAVAPGEAAALPDARPDGTAPGPADPVASAVPEGVADTPSDGAPDDGPSGVEACRGAGSWVDTPGCSIGAMGGFFGRGRGVIPDTQA